MENLTYVTGNIGKYEGIKYRFENENIFINYYILDIEEPYINDIEYISKEKAKYAYKLLKEPVFVVDSGFYIEDYPDNPGYPGAFAKRSNISTDVDNLLITMKNVINRNCYFLDCLTFYDGNEFYQFFGKSEGVISYEKKGHYSKDMKSNLWYVFIPKDCSKTLAEMTKEERNIKSNSISATTEFIKWYKINYLKNANTRKRLNK